MNDGGSAFPRAMQIDRDLHVVVDPAPGMTLRDYFAAHAPPMGKEYLVDALDRDAIADWNYGYADAMLRRRAK